MILNFEDFVSERRVIQKQRQLMLNIFEQFDELEPVLNEAYLLVEAGIFDGSLEQLNEESILQKAKARFDKAVDVAKEKGKKALTDTQQKIIQLGGNIVNVIKLIVTKLKEWITTLFEKAKSAYSAAASAKSSEITKELEGKSDEYKNKLLKEIGQFKQVAKAVAAWATAGFVKDSEKAAMTAVKQDEALVFELAMLETINEAVINGTLNFNDLLAEGEGGIPFVSSIAHKMHDIPPFNLLDKVKKAAEKVAGGILNKISYYATELAGAPGPFEFVALATIIGIITEVQVKGVAKHAVLHAIPGLGTIAAIISNVAMGLAVIAVIETVIKKEKE